MNEPATGRPPEGWLETLQANSRPQPAIPAVLVLLLSIMIPVMSLQPGATPDHTSIAWLLLPIALLASCGLAIAAGFCSVFPQIIWILIAAWALKFTVAGGPMPSYNRYLLIAGMLACTGMFFFQVYRVHTGRFVPTVRDPEPEPRED